MTASPITHSECMVALHPSHYLELPDQAYQLVSPEPVRAPELLAWNASLAESFALTSDHDEAKRDWLAVLAGNQLPEHGKTLALAYAGHQFGHFVPQLGDGRALILGELHDDDSQSYDLQLKGSGRTPFSRNGDGRCPLAPALREYLISEAMHAMGIPTTRSLAVMATGERVQREQGQPGGIVARIASSHLRIGTLEYFAAREDDDALRAVCDDAIARHYPDIKQSDQPYRALLLAVTDAQASLIARWMLVGFIHGVMNTDNMTLSGETIDFGPCAFMDRYDPATVFSSVDHYGRYAYGNQPHMALWNLMSLTEVMYGLSAKAGESPQQLGDEVAGYFTDRFERYWHEGMRAKLGVNTKPDPDDLPLITALLELMTQHELDYTATFIALADRLDPQANHQAIISLPDHRSWKDWEQRWLSAVQQQPNDAVSIAKAMRAVNPTVIPRNYLVEAALEQAVQGDMHPFHQLYEAVTYPYTQPKELHFMAMPEPSQRVYQTFCGT